MDDSMVVERADLWAQPQADVLADLLVYLQVGKSDECLAVARVA